MITGEENPSYGWGGWTGVNNSSLLPVVYDNRIVEPLIGGWTGVINSPLLPLAYDNRSVERLIGVGGVDWGD